MAVFKEYYEVVGTAKRRAMAFEQERSIALNAQWKIAQSFDADGFRPWHHGEIKSLIYPNKVSIPGLRFIGRDGKRFEYRPSLNTKAGKEIARVLSSAPRVKEWGEFANTFGWKGRSPIASESGRSFIYHCAGVHVSKPRDRFFMQYPRELKDRWTPPEGLKQVRESDMLRAIENHNALIKQDKAAARSTT